MTIKYFGKKYGGWIDIEGFHLTYYFYKVQEHLTDEKVLAKVWTNKSYPYLEVYLTT